MSSIITQEAAQFTDEQRRQIIDVICKGFDESEAKFFTQVAEAVNLNPLKRQIYAMKRWDSTLNRNVMQIMTSIEGLRAIAARSKTHDGKDCYAGNSKPKYTFNKDGFIDSAEVTVLRIVQGEVREFTAEAFYDESVQMAGIYEGQGNNKRKVGEKPNAMWQKRPKGQTAKCAEAQALRKAFPEETGGLYIEEEGPSDHEVDVAPAKSTSAPKPQAEGMEVAGTTVLPPEDNKPLPRHWSDLLIENAYQGIVFGENTPWPGKMLWEVAKTDFEKAFKEVPREDNMERLALDCAYFVKLKTRLAKKGYDLDDAMQALRKTGFLEADADITQVPGERLLDLGTAITELPKLEN